MTLRYVPGPEEPPRGGREGSGGGGGGPIVGDRRRRALSEPRRVALVVTAVVGATLFPLVAMPLSSTAAWVALAIGVGIAFFIATSIKRTSDDIDRREEARGAPRCRLCGRRYDEPLGEVAADAGRRCEECGRAMGA